ncbi:MAG: ion transporter [Bacteroidia bacterium]
MSSSKLKMSGKPIDDGLSLINLLVLVLSFYVLGILIVDALIDLPPEVHKLIVYTDYIACSVFFLDFLIRFFRAESKLAYMKWGWIDLLASIPANGVFRLGRIARVIQIIRVIKAYRSISHIVENIFKNHMKGTFTFAVIVAFMLILFSSVLILEVETAPNSNIKTAEDALWWAYVTITTVGYGDLYPVTTEGRIVALVLMTAGVGLFGVFTGYLASWFVEPEKEKEDEKTDPED